MQDPVEMSDFLASYERYVEQVLKPSQLEIRDILGRWQRPDHWTKYQRTNRIPIPSPIKSVFSRIKRPEQVVDKICRKSARFPLGLRAESFHSMHDALGVRVVVFVPSHLPLVDRELRESDLFDTSTDEPPTAYMPPHEARMLSLDHCEHVEKESGYRAVHYVLRLRSSEVPADRRPWFEVQVQTAAQELWSALEHHLGYKPSGPTHAAARRQLNILATTLAAIDEHFDLIYEELNRYQQEAVYDDGDPLSAENLPAVLGEVGISCAQRDINNILKFLYSRGVANVHDVRALAAPRRMAMIRTTYLSVAGRVPANLEVIASLAALRGAPDEASEVERIRSQIAFRGAWSSIRQEFLDSDG